MPNRQQAITGTNAGPVCWWIYAALGGWDELMTSHFTNSQRNFDMQVTSFNSTWTATNKIYSINPLNSMLIKSNFLTPQGKKMWVLQIMNLQWYHAQFTIIRGWQKNNTWGSTASIVNPAEFYLQNIDVCLHLTHLPLGQNGRHFTNDIFRCIFMNEKFSTLIKISVKFVPKVPIDNIPALV